MLPTILTIVGVSLFGSFLCSLFEAALYSVTPTRVEALRRKGVPGAAKLAALRGRVDEPIAAILTFNTITHTMGATWAGALVGETYGNTWVTWFSVAFTIAILFLTEIVPKTYGVVHANTLGPLTAWPIQFMIWLVWPLAWLSVRLTERLSRGAKQSGPTEDEILVMADMAVQAGKLQPNEQAWLKNALQLNDVKARDLLTPRSVVEWVPVASTLADYRNTTLTHSRLPVVEGNDLLNVRGIVYRRDLYDRLAAGQFDLQLADLMRPAKFVPETLPADSLLKQFLEERQHLAVVVTEHGDVTGIVTLEDVLEYLLGQEVVDEYDLQADMQHAARRLAARRQAGLQAT